VLEVLNYFEVNFLIYQSDNLFNLKVIEKNEICPHLIPLKITFQLPLIHRFNPTSPKANL
jgi:hypothetical protein